jgi:hypothetical protein
MKRGSLSDYFVGVAWKTLSGVETDRQRSNQHEFNGSASLVQLLGTPAGKANFPASFVYLGSDEDDRIAESAFATWYDSRARHPTRSEWRLYFPHGSVPERMREGDLLVIARRPDDTLLVAVAEGRSTMASQLLWLFGLDAELASNFHTRDLSDETASRNAYATAAILEAIGVTIDLPDASYLDLLQRRFGNEFPPTAEFSSLAREVAGEVDAARDPDEALMAWMETEERLFRVFERRLVEARLDQGFGRDVDAFVAYSLTVQNRRKARAGRALENHLAEIFAAWGIRHSRSAQTEHKAKPDFLFPGVESYRDPRMDIRLLTVLGAKSTCKDRWRQVLTEADRIQTKHLLTLEPAITPSQTEEMQANHLQLVVPRALHETYRPPQRAWLLDLGQFTTILVDRQREADGR